MKKCGEDVVSIELALLNRSEDAREHGVRLGAAFRSIAPADCARDNRGPERVFGPPVRGFDRIGFEKERKHRWEFRGKMCREAAGDMGGARSINERMS